MTFKHFMRTAVHLVAITLVAAAAPALAKKDKPLSPCPATIAVVGGTFLNDAMLTSSYLSKSFTIKTEAGTSPPIWCGKAGDLPFYYVHMHGGGKYVETWAALYKLGVTDAIGGATAGGINPYYKTQDFIIPDDFIDMNVERPRSLPGAIFPPGEVIIPRYIPAVDPLIADILADESKKRIAKDPKLAGASVYMGGVLWQAPGGRFETRAEVRMIQQLGGDLVTMSVATEMTYARMVGINYANVVVISNPAEGLGAWKFDSLTDIYGAVNPASLEIVINALPRVAALKGQPRVGDALRIHPKMTDGEKAKK